MALFSKAALAFLRGHGAQIVLATGAGLRGAGAQSCSQILLLKSEGFHPKGNERQSKERGILRQNSKTNTILNSQN